MRNDIKKLVSSVIAVVMTASMSVSVFAADYATVPSFPAVPSGSSSATSAEMIAAVKATEEKVNGAVDSAVAAAADTIDLDSTGESKEPSTASVEVKSVSKLAVNPATVKKLAKSNVALEIVSPKATITIDPATITKARKIDLSMKVVNSAVRTKVKFRSKKDFGCDVQIALTACKMSAKKLASAHVYCDGEDLGPVELNDDGVPVITVKKGGVYEVK